MPICMRQADGMLWFAGVGIGLLLLSVWVPFQFQMLAPLITIPVGVCVGVVYLLHQEETERRWLAGILVLFLAGLLLVYKTPAVVEFAEEVANRHADLGEVDSARIRWEWIGISYLSFRLIAVLLEFRAGRLKPLNLQEMLAYALFTPALVAGPIDRVDRFTADLRASYPLDTERFLRGGRRLVSGIFRKFVLADTLALVALSPQLAQDIDSAPAAWLAAYLYAFQIFFDFSGYTEIAIGLGTWAGIDLPENFNRPYLRQNLALFWQNWHMTLTGWFRAYVFLPLTRSLLRWRLPVSEFLIGQVITMTLIALWHGVSGHFILWGLWHALGLYAHHLLQNWTRRWYLRARQKPWLNRIIMISGVLATFHFVVIGWIFFVLPQPFDFLGKLVGF